MNYFITLGFGFLLLAIGLYCALINRLNDRVFISINGRTIVRGTRYFWWYMHVLTEDHPLNKPPKISSTKMTVWSYALLIFRSELVERD